MTAFGLLWRKWNMKALFIGGTGTISAWPSSAACRGSALGSVASEPRQPAGMVPEGVHQIIATSMMKRCGGEDQGSVFRHGLRVHRLYPGRRYSGTIGCSKERPRQYIYTSSASAYHKPAADLIITEGTTLANPYWQYSRDKIACEEYLMEKYREEGFR